MFASKSEFESLFLKYMPIEYQSDTSAMHYEEKKGHIHIVIIIRFFFSNIGIPTWQLIIWLYISCVLNQVNRLHGHNLSLTLSFVLASAYYSAGRVHVEKQSLQNPVIQLWLKKSTTQGSFKNDAYTPLGHNQHWSWTKTGALPKVIFLWKFSG